METDPAMAIVEAAMSQQRALEEATAPGDSDVQRFYRGAVVLLTGGTGFMGKQLIEKLFRSCEISKMYLLIRPKTGKDIQDRVEEMLRDPAFDTVRKFKPQFCTQLVAVAGDVAEERLGLSERDWDTLAHEITVVFHMAATTRFDDSLRVATLINVRGTREALLLGKACKNLKAFVHISTAYAHATSSLVGQEICEQFRTSPAPPDTLMSMVLSLQDAQLDDITKELILDWPNTYTFAKAVAEELIRTMSAGMPICIVRPGIVQAAYREPSPGWLDVRCAYGASGLLLGAGLGVLHTMLSRHHTKLGIVPCDYVNNAIIVAGSAASRSTGGENTTIYTASPVTRNPVLYGLIPKIMRRDVSELNSPEAVYYCFGSETSYRFLYIFLTWLLHIIPGYAVDSILLLLGKERRMVKLYKKVFKMQNALSHFTLNSWLFVDKNLEQLYKSLSATDKIIFNCDVASIDWEEYIRIWCVGIRKYIVKDGLTGTKKANRKTFYLKCLHYLLTCLYFYLIWKILCFVYFVFSSVFWLINFISVI